MKRASQRADDGASAPSKFAFTPLPVSAQRREGKQHIYYIFG
jgi:hypothetical protein